MPDNVAFTSSFSDNRDTVPAEDLLHGILNISLTGYALYQPVYGASGKEVRDFTFVLLNPKARQILSLPDLPTQTYLELYPHTLETGVFAFHCHVFASGQPERFSVNYQGDGLDNYFHLSAQRVGDLLLVNFTDTAEQSRTAVEQALRQSQAREHLARAEAEAQRNRLHHLFMQAPAMITIFEGPQHVFKLVNPLYQELVGDRPLLGKPIREAMPELADQPIFDLLDYVYQTGETFRATEMQVQLDHDNTGKRGQRFYNFIYQASRNLAEEIDGILVFAYDVTEQVQARQRAEASEQQLAYTNEELAATNEELAATNEELLTANFEILTNNSELEQRVAARTREAQQAQAEAERQRGRLEQLFMQAPAGICILGGPELVFELVNPVYQQLFPGRDLLGKPVLEALPEIADHAVYNTFRWVYNTGQTHQELGMLIPLNHPDDGRLQDRYFNYIQQPRLDENSRIDGVVVFAYEVTDLEQARRKLEQSEVAFRTLANAISNLVWTTTPSGEADYYNEQWYSFTGSSPQEVLGQGWTTYFHPHDLLLMLRQWHEALAQGTPYQVEARLRRADGAYRWFLVRAVAMHDDQGHILRWFGTNTDIHEQKEMAEALQLATRKLAASNKELRTANEQAKQANRQLELTNEQLTRINDDLDNFVYTASHDLQQPVHNMAGVFDELKRTATFHDPEAEQLMHMFEDALGQIQSTIQGLAQVVQAERQTQGLPTEVVELLPLTQSVLQSMRSQITEQQAQVELDFAAVPQLLFGRLNLQSILYNLLSNALKYAHPDRPPTVLVSTRLTAGGSPILLVQDNGLGMDLSRFGPELFKMFRRFHDHVPGSGLGLYLVNRIVQQAGGHVEVSSSPDAGTTFRLHFPSSLLPTRNFF
ncbi:PAS domain-containing protein [Hymenobacter sp. HSC-4F20]|uniref:PAS domain-containing protein n=1 Tax=Hymenobacter sp. HSC-4F20 TaxID=2864135 RepID=UPI001C738846|nr:PAS domain-containing protein [Hymenobacter sp. HSC-4F20]MBX0289073.1 PAS domain-containing protein [Hymenobacter sp. HSC-4F20]